MAFSTDNFDRNPSPPPEILEKDGNFVPDRIGSTLYSKRWLYKTLMSMLKVVEEYSSLENNSHENNSSKNDEEMNTNQIIELDPKIEEDACTLWDMSANLEVAEFLCECNVADIFLAIIEPTKSPRLLEIVVGILGNMSSFNTACEYISKNEALVNVITMLSGCSDSCTLAQLFRLLTCGIIKESCQMEWFQAFKENAFFMENVKCILENNLCRDVLCGILEFLDRLLSYDTSFAISIWIEESYTSAIIECGKQLLKCNHFEDLDLFFLALYNLCQQSKNSPVYGKQFEALRPIFHEYFSKLGDEEYLPQISRVKAIMIAFAFYGDLLYSGNVVPEHVLFDDISFKAMLNLCNKIKSLLTNLKTRVKNSQNQFTEEVSSITVAEERNGEASDREDIIDNWKILLQAIIHAAKACSRFAKQENEIHIINEIISFKTFTEDLVS